MKNRIIMTTLVSITLFGLSLVVTAAQSQIINLVANESLEINCDGDTLNVTFDGQTKVIAECSPGDITPTPTDQPSTPYDNWLDTDAHNSLEENDDLFNVIDLEGTQVLGTTSSLKDIHSHFVGAGSDTLSNYEFVGQMVTTAANGGFGVTFFSQYPQQDTYYRLGRNGGQSFQLSSHGTSISGGTTDTGVIPEENMWYHFRIEVRDTGTRTEMKAKIWPTTSSEPGDWQVEAFDDSPTRLTAGTIGVWSMSSGGKYWHNISTNSLPEPTDPPEPEPTDTPTPVPTDTPTPEPTDTPTPVPTDTPTPVPTDTPTPVPTDPVDDPDPADHDVTTWHPPTEAHHHGFNVMDTEFADLWIEQTGQTIAYPWLSSPTENLFPFSNGKHEGFKGLHEADTGCRHFNLDGGENCVKSYFLMVHSIGNVPAILTRIHSFALAAKVCTGPDGNQPCGYIFTGGHQDYGVLHNQYKTDICRLSNDPGSYPYETTQGINQPPYRTGHQTTDKPPTSTNAQFWSSLINPIFFPYYPHLPNNIVGLAWSSNDAWSYINGDSNLCSIAAEGVEICPDGSCDFNHSEFQVFSIRLRNLPTERPFFGYTNVNGHIDETCTETSPTCVPLFISEGVPQGSAYLNTPVRIGFGEAPLQEFDDGTPLKAPSH